MGEAKAIYTAMVKVMADVGVVGKERKNPQQGYQFRGIDDVAAHCQAALEKHGVFVVPEVLEREREVMDTRNGGRMASVRLLVRHTFFAHDGSSVAATTLGEAMDSGDKASNKAMSAALKYALTESLMIPTYEADRDTEEASPEVVPPTRAQAVPAPRAAPAPAPGGQRAAPPVASSSRVTHFPAYGRAKGAPIAGATAKDLEFYAAGARKSLADPAKAKWHDHERALLEAIALEQRRQAGGTPAESNEPPPPSDEDAPF